MTLHIVIQFCSLHVIDDSLLFVGNRVNTTTEPNADCNIIEPAKDDNDVVPRKSNEKKSVFKSGHYCCVVNCHRRTGRPGKDNVSFFHVLRANKTQTDMWCQAIRRENPDGLYGNLHLLLRYVGLILLKESHPVMLMTLITFQVN